jgi:hypothetical protein
VRFYWLFVKFLMANELIFYLKRKLNSGILIQNLFWICIWLQNKSCSFWNVMKSNQFSQFVELCNSCFGISFEVAVLRIYCVTCYVGLLTSGPDHSSNGNFWRKISIPHNFIWTRITSNLDTTLNWLKYWKIWSYITN